MELEWNLNIYYHCAVALLLWQYTRPQAVPASPRADRRANRSSRTPALAQTVALQNNRRNNNRNITAGIQQKDLELLPNPSRYD